MGVIRQMTGTEVDPLGLGLIGTRGLLIYVASLASLAGLLYVAVVAVRRGLIWTRWVQRCVLGLPAVGKPLQTLALARLTWSIYLTMNAGMEIRRALKLSLRSTRNARYTDQIDRIDASIAEGSSIYEAFSLAGAYPADFLNSLAVGEESGKVVESMAALARQYRDRAQTALAALTALAGFAVWGIVALLIITLIFRLFMFYCGMMYDLTSPLTWLDGLT